MAPERRDVIAPSSFSVLGLSESLQKAIRSAGYTVPTPIQEQAIPSLLSGRDLLGCAQTGTGKTAAFALPVLQRLTAEAAGAPRRSPRALVLTPTRELAAQVSDSFRTYGRNQKLSVISIFGGVGQERQVRDLERGVDILVATPGRLLDLLGQRKLRLDQVEVLVLDEADRMLDMGFINDIRRILKLVPEQRQNLLFSATMPAEIAKLASSILKNPVRVEVTPPASTVTLINETVLNVEQPEKRTLLSAVLRNPGVDRALVFSRTKHGANRIVKQLAEDRIPAEALHGNKSQAARQRALDNFKSGQTMVLVATNIAARGIDVTGISHVINFDLPDDPDSYVHRIGRTARAGASGQAITFCASAERATLRIVERLIGHRIPVGDVRQYLAAAGPAPAPQAAAARPAAPIAEAPRRNSRPQQQRRQAGPRRTMANTGPRR